MYSVRVMALSAAFYGGVPLVKVCRTATWMSLDIFVYHCVLDVLARRDAVFGTAVLQSLFK